MIQHTKSKYKQLFNNCISCKFIEINSIINYNIKYNTVRWIHFITKAEQMPSWRSLDQVERSSSDRARCSNTSSSFWSLAGCISGVQSIRSSRSSKMARVNRSCFPHVVQILKFLMLHLIVARLAERTPLGQARWDANNFCDIFKYKLRFNKICFKIFGCHPLIIAATPPYLIN